MNSNLSADVSFELELAGNESTQETDEEIDPLFDFIVYGLLLNTIGVFGIAGNVVSMVVLSQPHMKSSINYLLYGVTASDTVLIVTAILQMGLPSIYEGTGYLFFYYYRIEPFVELVVHPLYYISLTLSVYLRLVVALERYVAVCWPLRARSLCTCHRARFYVIAVLVFSVLYNITRFWELTIEQRIHPSHNILIYEISYTAKLLGNDLYCYVYDQWMYLIFICVLPMVIFVWLHWCIYWKVRKAYEEGQKLSRQQRKTIRLTVILSIFVMIFLLANLAALLFSILEALEIRYSKRTELMEFDNLMATIHASLNFIICLIFVDKFKEQLCNSRLLVNSNS